MSLQEMINNLNTFEEIQRNYSDFACSIMPIDLAPIEPKTSIAKNIGNIRDFYSLDYLNGLSDSDEKSRALIQEAISMIRNDKWIEGTLPVFDKTKLTDESGYYDTSYCFNNYFFVKVKGPNNKYNPQDKINHFATMRECVYLLSWKGISSSKFPKKRFKSRRNEAIQELENCVNFYYNNIKSYLYGSQKYVLHNGNILFEDGYHSFREPFAWEKSWEQKLADLVRANQ